MKIAIIGAGNIGGTLGAKWARGDHEIVFGVRDPGTTKIRYAQAVVSGLAQVNTIHAALAFGDIVLLAVPGSVVESLVVAYHSALDGKIILDATNNIRAPEMSAVSVLTARLPRARVFRAFHNLGWENFEQPIIGGVQADLFYCGSDDATDRAVVEQLIGGIGLHPVYVGGLEQVVVVDNLTRLWFALVQTHGRHLAFKMLAP